ncbi:hypothetical protein Tco_0481824 [Tanacetum coccineum]
MRTRSQARKRRQQQVRQTSVEPPNLEKPNNNQELFNPPIVTMADNRTMAQLLEAKTHREHGRFNDLLRGCPHHGFSELHQLDTFYNSLNSNDQDSLNSAAGGNFLDKMPRECLKIIESKSKVRQSRSKAIVSKVSTNSSPPAVSSDIAELKDMVRALILDKKNQTPAPAPVKAVEQSCVTCGGGHSYQNCPATDGNIYRDNIQEYVSQAAAVNYNQGNASYRPQMVANQIRPPGQVYQPQINQPPTFQAPAYQAPVTPAPGTDKSKITRKQSKTSKPGHENQKSTKPKPKPKSFSISKGLSCYSRKRLKDWVVRKKGLEASAGHYIKASLLTHTTI